MPVTISCWNTPMQSLDLAPGELHLWRFRLDLPTPEIALLLNCLSADELRRVERLLVLEKRQQFIVARANLRKLLGLYLDLAPVEIEFSYGEQGKPALCSSAQIFFNLSHSGNWALLAVSETGEVGVDIEQIDAALDYQKLAERYFTEQELSELNAASEQRRRRVFYRLWTRKESLLKLSGKGFFSPTGQQQNTLLTQCQLLPLMNKFIGAVAFPLELTSIKRFQSTEK